MKWSTSDLTFYADTLTPSALTEKQTNLANSVFNRYAEIANIKFEMLDPSKQSQADLIIQNSGSVGTGGVTNFGANGSTVIIKVGSSSYQPWIIMSHEIGHFLGLDHIWEKINGQWIDNKLSDKYDLIDTIMSYTFPYRQQYAFESPPPGSGSQIYFDANIDDLGIHDIAAIQYLYGANTSHNSTNTTYQYAAVPFYDTIWDGGGVDTIDVSNFKLGSKINLNNGTRSDVYFAPSAVYSPENQWTYTGERAIGIAYGANIENARGTQGNDTIYGNELDNTIWGENGGDIIYGNAGNDLLYGGAGDDILDGGTGDDILDGGTGSDTLIGGLGNDTYYIDNINDVITESYNEGNDTVITSLQSYTLGKNIENLTLISNGSGYGNELDNIIQGSNANNRLVGGRGNDTLRGGAGSDVYVYNFKNMEGLDTIYETSDHATPNDIDVLTFGVGITQEEIWFQKISASDGVHLEISRIGSKDEKVTVKNWFDNNCRIEKMEIYWGKSITDDKVDQLVSAMAAFSPPALGQTTLPSNYQQALSPVITAAWS